MFKIAMGLLVALLLCSDSIMDSVGILGFILTAATVFILAALLLLCEATAKRRRAAKRRKNASRRRQPKETPSM